MDKSHFYRYVFIIVDIFDSLHFLTQFAECSQVDRDSYVVKISSVQKFEEKLRKAEHDLGIKEERGVPVIYKRNR